MPISRHNYTRPRENYMCAPNIALAEILIRCCLKNEVLHLSLHTDGIRTFPGIYGASRRGVVPPS